MSAILEVKNLTKVYKRKKKSGGGNLTAVNDVSFAVDGGEIVGFLGPNGAGKSTTIKMIAGLATPTSGSITVCGYDVFKFPEKAKMHIGGVIEGPDMYKDMSGEDNLNYFAALQPADSLVDPLRPEQKNLSTKELIKQRVDELLTLVGLADRRKDKVGKYSLGMKQRLGIAQAILGYPKLLILDEPANGLDPAGIKGVRKLLQKLAEDYNMAIMVSSHQLAEMQQLCERVIIINDGVITAEKNLSDIAVDESGLARVVIKTDKPDEVKEYLAAKYDGYLEIVDGAVVFHTAVTTPELTRELVMAGFNIYGMSTDTVKLEDIFIDATNNKEGE